jgi:hypothetical protein
LLGWSFDSDRWTVNFFYFCYILRKPCGFFILGLYKSNMSRE